MMNGLRLINKNFIISVDGIMYGRTTSRLLRVLASISLVVPPWYHCYLYDYFFHEEQFGSSLLLLLLVVAS